MPPPLAVTTFQARTLAGEAPATVRVRNLRATLRRAGRDAWGRAGRAQPCAVSAEVAFAAPFGSAARDDRLGAGDTVHYGTLSRAVLASLAAFESRRGVERDEAGEGEEEVGGLRSVLEALWTDLTGLRLLDGERKEEEEEEEGKEKRAFLDLARVRFLSVAVALPKASLLGEGVSLTASAVFDGAGRMQARALALEIARLRVPTLVGVNPNERLSRQFVVATVAIDGFSRAEDVYTEIEGVVVKVGALSILSRYHLRGRSVAWL